MTTDPSHYAEIKPSDKTWQVFFQDELLLESDEALELHEHHQGRHFDPVIYFPSVDDMKITRTEHSTHCPIKGDASYWSFAGTDNAIWSYLDPMPEVSAIRGFDGFMASSGFEVRCRQI